MGLQNTKGEREVFNYRNTESCAGNLLRTDFRFGSPQEAEWAGILHFPRISRSVQLPRILWPLTSPEGCTCRQSVYVMAARRLFGAIRTWAGWGVRELPDPTAPGRLLVRDYAKRPVIKGGKGSKGGVVSEALKDPEVCTDPVQLTTHAMGVNIYKEGQDVVLKPDAEYPEWLFQMNVGPPKKLEELDPETREYWRLLRKHNIWRHNRLSKNRKF